MTKTEKLTRKLNDDFRDLLAVAVREKFAIEIETRLDLFGSGCLVTSRTDGHVLTPEQFTFIAAYEQGYGDAMDIVRGQR